jgi:hypothetical protein
MAAASVPFLMVIAPCLSRRTERAAGGEVAGPQTARTSCPRNGLSSNCPTSPSHLDGILSRDPEMSPLTAGSCDADRRVLVSPVLIAERQTWTTPPPKSTSSHVSFRNSIGRRPQ